MAHEPGEPFVLMAIRFGPKYSAWLQLASGVLGMTVEETIEIALNMLAIGESLPAPPRHLSD